MRFPWQKTELPSPKQIAEEFIACLITVRPGTKLKRYSAELVDAEMPDGGGCVFMLQKVHVAVQRLKDPNQEARFRVYLEHLATTLQNLDDQAQEERIGPNDRHRVLPRLMHPDFLDQVAQHAPGLDVPRRTFYETGLIIVYVLDSEQRVAYIMGPQAEALELDEAGLYSKSLENARKIFPRAEFRSRLDTMKDPIGDGCRTGIIRPAPSWFQSILSPENHWR